MTVYITTAILLRWLHEPTTREFGLDKLVVVVAHTGDEYAATLRDAQDVVLRLLARYRVRLVQAGRSRLNTTAAGAGISVFDDSTQPTHLYADRGYALSDELLAAGTVPQLGSRRCSLRAKGAVLDPIIGTLTGGQPFRHYLGFETGELRRAQRDTAYNTATRRGVYPLLEWQRSRTDALDYLHQVSGLRWQKSACSYCPFQFSSKAGRADALERCRRDPHAGARALYLEHLAACLNPRQSLLAQGRLIDLVRTAGLTEVVDRFTTHIAAQPHALYEVRRVATPRRAATPAIARSVRQVHTGPVAALDAALTRLPVEIETTADGITRGWRHRRGTVAPWAEHFYVVAPSTTIADKQRPGFEAMYAQVTGGTPTLVA
ncbi:hypothetical protein Mycch_5482 (plasmid) [Mycolicibacterium chubuense NBB4]|uniref:Phosphoadenosine phosphosulphate reductase domain-containing protein n=1 Tax=Mycolicibacterium chubuense (strain NBB4) TaxID=710421 RepID=I4BS93_MYCCN|nr:hypothetical protein [Mycolicibacterium chubuense]AFM20150.1 hypothetical protein Mycch_5482 [Mycolicibacterium chubuense NBB4]